MAHTCPDCGALCHCGGDIDDIQWGEDSPESDACSHFLSPGCSAYEDDEPDEEPDSEDEW